ncbi:hypothetical protein SEA_ROSAASANTEWAA_34 [Streptomyces phage RosaAsantewaa]|nr:hypothetical protein SEA_ROSAASANTEWAA_34 [Streptomyces phage RosaAsantewaa]
MEEYPSNSQFKKPEAKPESAEIEQKDLKKIVNGKVIRKKRTLTSRLLESFSGDDGRSVMDYVLFDVLIPAAKDAMVDAIKEGAERIFFGDARGTSRRVSRSGGAHPTNYNSRYNVSTNRPAAAERPAARRRTSREFEPVILETRAEAQDVIETLVDIQEKFGQATVSDMNDLVGQTGTFTDEKWGWTELGSARVTRVREGYLVDLPAPEHLN